jgi:hypothetical protein
MENGSKLGHSKYLDSGPERSTWKVGVKVGKLQSNISSNMACCKISHGPISLIFYPTDKVNTVADCLENQFRAHDLCRNVEAQFEALLATVDEDIFINFRLCDVSKQYNNWN